MDGGPADGAGALSGGEVPLLDRKGPVRDLLMETPLVLLAPHCERLLFGIRLADGVAIMAPRAVPHPRRGPRLGRRRPDLTEPAAWRGGGRGA